MADDELDNETEALAYDTSKWSRYVLEAFEPTRYKVDVGWDANFRTYFVQVFDAQRKADDGSNHVFCAGMNPEELSTVDALADAMERFAVIPPDIRDKLHQDQTLRKWSYPLMTRNLRFKLYSASWPEEIRQRESAYLGKALGIAAEKLKSLIEEGYEQLHGQKRH